MARLSIAARLYGLIALFGLGLALFGTAAVLAERDTLRSERMAQLDALVRSAGSIADRYREAAAQGKMTEAEAKAAAFADIGAIRYGSGDYLFVMDAKGVMLVHPSAKLIGTDFTKVSDASGSYFVADVLPRALRDGSASVPYLWARPNEEKPSDKLSLYAHYKPWNVVIATGVYVDDLRAALWAACWRLAVVGALIVLVLGIGTALVARSIIRPLAHLGASMRALAAGDTAVAVVAGTDRHEVGAMAASLAVLRDGLAERESLAAAQAEDHAGRARRAGEFDMLTSRFEADIVAVTDELRQASGTMEETAHVMTQAVGRTTTQSGGAAAAAEQTSANVQTVAAATEELAASIREIAAQVVRSSQIAGSAAEEARRTDGMVKALATTAERIGGVIAVINSIASQTNLLALNATIEAARAGEAGRGFAVVAAEVKELASQTAKATEEVAGQIAAIQGETRQAVEAIEGIGRIIQEVDTIASGIAAAMEEQGAATEEIARNVQEAATGTRTVTGAIGEMREGTDAAQAATDHVLASAKGLARASDALTMTVRGFLSDVKAA
jgi:methyl-accepting chemotaxis protein